MRGTDLLKGTRSNFIPWLRIFEHRGENCLEGVVATPFRELGLNYCWQSGDAILQDGSVAELLNAKQLIWRLPSFNVPKLWKSNMCNQVKVAPNMADSISIKDSDSRLKLDIVYMDIIVSF